MRSYKLRLVEGLTEKKDMKA